MVRSFTLDPIFFFSRFHRGAAVVYAPFVFSVRKNKWATTTYHTQIPGWGPARCRFGRRSKGSCEVGVTTFFFFSSCALRPAPLRAWFVRRLHVSTFELHTYQRLFLECRRHVWTPEGAQIDARGMSCIRGKRCGRGWGWPLVSGVTSTCYSCLLELRLCVGAWQAKRCALDLVFSDFLGGGL